MNSERLKERILGFLQSRLFLAILVGVLLVLADMKFGFISIFLGGYSSLLVIGVAVGIIVGRVKDGILAMLGVSVLSVFLMVLLLPIIYPGWAAVIFYEGHFILLDLLMVAVDIIWQSATLGILGQPWYEVYLTPEGQADLGLIFMAPFVYGISLVFGGLGGFFGKHLWKYLKREEKSTQSAEVIEPETAEN